MTEGVERVVNEKQLVALVEEAKRVQSRTSSISGEFGERVKAAVENGHLNRRAFGIVSGLHKITDEQKRNDAIRSLRLYLDMLDPALWNAGHTGDLFDCDDDQQDSDETVEDEDVRPPFLQQQEAERIAAAEASEANAAALKRGIKPLSDDGAGDGKAAGSYKLN